MGGEYEVLLRSYRNHDLEAVIENGVTIYFNITFPDNHCGSALVGWFCFLQSVAFCILSVSSLPFHFFPSSPLAFEEFATSLVKEEMANMPRGIYHSALRGNAVRSDHGKTLSSVPNFMMKMHERNKQPGLKPGLAGKILSMSLCIPIDFIFMSFREAFINLKHLNVTIGIT